MDRPRRWTIAAPNPAADALAARLKVSPIIAQILLNRGIAEPDDCERFLQPSLKLLHDPAGIPNLTAAAQRIARAIRDREKIVIYGDYDVDGITATSILWHAIRMFDGEVDYYIPHRLDEGYGLNADAVAEICAAGAKLIVTVDCGVTAVEPANVARQRGVDLIITDHHEWHVEAGSGARVPGSGRNSTRDADPGTRNPILPDCYTIVHPRLPHEGQPYSNPHLCGAGVAFKLAWGIGQAISGATRVNETFRSFLVEATALAALGTIADVVPLIGENRVLAAYGLGGLKQSQLTGIRALIASAGLSGQKLDSYDVGFKLAPRLNACGRMGHAALAVEMLTKADQVKAQEIATYLTEQNRQRQSMEKKILEQAIEQVQANGFDREDCRAIVLGAEGWHAGIIGIVAARLVDRYHRPSVMIGLTDGMGQGSGRSIAGFHLARALEACGEHLEAFGGHEMAAGLKIQATKLDDFRAAFCAHADDVLDDEMLIPELKMECALELRHLTGALVADLARLGPFGHGNRKPVLCCRGLTVAAPPRRVGGNGEHLQLLVRQGQQLIKCIAFRQGDLSDRLQPGTVIDLAGEPTLNEFNGRTSVELEVRDIQLPLSA